MSGGGDYDENGDDCRSDVDDGIVAGDDDGHGGTSSGGIVGGSSW